LKSERRPKLNFVKNSKTVSLCFGLLALTLTIWQMVIPSGLKPWSYALGKNSNYFLDLLGRVSNIDQLHQTGNIYLNFGHLAFTYPPAAIFIFFWLTVPTQTILVTFWTILNTLFLYLIISKGNTNVKTLHRLDQINCNLWLTIGSIIVLPPIYECFALGQIGLVLFYLIFFDYFSKPKKLKGLLLGIATGVKIYPIIFILAWICQKKYKESCTAMTVAATLNLFAYFVWPTSSLYFYKNIIFGGAEMSHLLDGIKKLGSSSFISPLIRSPFNLGSANKFVLLGLITSYALVVICLSVKLNNRGYVLTSFVVIAFASATCSIVTWDHYFIFIVLIPFTLVEIQSSQAFRIINYVVLAIFIYPWWRFRFWSGHDVLSQTVVYLSTNALLFATLLYIFGSILLLLNSQNKNELLSRN